MGSSEKERGGSGERERLRRGREGGTRAAGGARRVLIVLGAILLAVAAFVGGVVPLVVGGVIHGASVVFLGVGGALAVLAAWLATKTDSPRERAITAVGLAGLTGLVIYMVI